VRYVRQRNHNKAAFEFAQAVLDPGSHVFKRERIFRARAGSVADRNTDLTHSSDALGDQGSMSLVKGLISANDQRCLPFGLEYRPHPNRHLLSPVFGRILLGDANIDCSRRLEETIGVFVSTVLNPIEPYDEGRAAFQKSFPSFLCRADEIGNGEAAGFYDLIAKPAHASGVLDPIFGGESEVSVDVMPDLVGIELHRI
jgi:hypothetical protein